MPSSSLRDDGLAYLDQLYSTFRKPEPVVKSQVDIDIDRAVERVYRTYGPDLSVFFAAVQREHPSNKNK